MSTLPDFNEPPPDRGDPGSIRSVAAAFDSAGSSSSIAGQSVGVADTALNASESEATTAVQGKLVAIKPQYFTLSSSAATASEALVAYASDLQILKDQANSLRTQGAEAYQRIQWVRGRAMETLLDQLVEVFVPWDGVPWAVLNTHSPSLGKSWEDAIRNYKSIASQYNALWVERQAMDNRLKSKLGSLPLAEQLGISVASVTSFATMRSHSKVWAGNHEFLTINDFQSMSNPATVNAAWEELSPEQRTKLLKSDPALFGNLQGIPYSDRHTANRIVLDQKRADSRLSDDIKAKLDVLNEALKADPDSRLISLEFEGDEPRAAVAVGDLDKATSVSYMVHGIKTDTSNIGAWAQGAADFRNALKAKGVSEQTAFVAWFRYDSGDDFTVSKHVLASAGAAKLKADLEGFAAVNPGAECVLIGYSYGTTVVGETLRTHSDYVDGVHLNGSAGLTAEARAAIESGVADKKFFVTASESSKDGIAPWGRNWFSTHQENPVHFEGVIVYSAEGGDVGGKHGEQVDDHDAFSGEPFAELDSVLNHGESEQKTEKLEELKNRGIEYEIRPVVYGRTSYDGVYTTSTGYFSPDSQVFMQIVREYANRLN